MKDLTPKQEAFAQSVAAGSTLAAAYRDNYDAGKMKAETIWAASSKLMSDYKVSIRVAELQEEAKERTLVTVESVTKEFDEARDLAKEERNAAAMKGAIEAKAKLHGLFEKDNTQKAMVVNLNGHEASF